jgi:hypothetical protein
VGERVNKRARNEPVRDIEPEMGTYSSDCSESNRSIALLLRGEKSHRSQLPLDDDPLIWIGTLNLSTASHPPRRPASCRFKRSQRASVCQR